MRKGLGFVHGSGARFPVFRKSDNKEKSEKTIFEKMASPPGLGGFGDVGEARMNFTACPKECTG